MAKVPSPSLESTFKDLAVASEVVYDNIGLVLAALKADAESAEYAACTFTLGGKPVLYRSSKITPKKIGQFVTLWKRNSKGITEPFSSSDPFDFIIISARSGSNFGQFIFPKSILLEKGIVSSATREGKRGIRVYPPWDKPTSRQAEKTQQWQVLYFLEIKEDGTTDLERASELITLLTV